MLFGNEGIPEKNSKEENHDKVKYYNSKAHELLEFYSLSRIKDEDLIENAESVRLF